MLKSSAYGYFRFLSGRGGGKEIRSDYKRFCTIFWIFVERGYIIFLIYFFFCFGTGEFNPKTPHPLSRLRVRFNQHACLPIRNRDRWDLSNQITTIISIHELKLYDCPAFFQCFNVTQYGNKGRSGGFQ